MSAVFKRIFDSEKVQTLEFNPSWRTIRDNFNGAVIGDHAPRVPTGTLVKSTAIDGRRLILIGTPKGNVLVAEHQVCETRKLVYAAPPAIDLLLANVVNPGFLTDTSLNFLFGDITCCMSPNIGKRMANLAR
jgi:hypothetical protein